MKKILLCLVILVFISTLALANNVLIGSENEPSTVKLLGTSYEIVKQKLAFQIQNSADYYYVSEFLKPLEDTGFSFYHSPNQISIVSIIDPIDVHRKGLYTYLTEASVGDERGNLIKDVLLVLKDPDGFIRIQQNEIVISFKVDLSNKELDDFSNKYNVLLIRKNKLRLRKCVFRMNNFSPYDQFELVNQIQSTRDPRINLVAINFISVFQY